MYDTLERNENRIKMDKINSAVFTSLKPVCDRLIVEVSEQTTNDLKELLPILPTKAVQKFQHYISLPIEVQLHKTSNLNHKQMLVETLTQLYTYSLIDSADTLRRLCLLLFQQVVDREDSRVLISGSCSEELKLSVVKCINRLWLSSMSEALYNIYNREYYPGLSPLIYMVTQLAKTEKLIQLRVEALECLRVICHVHDSVDTSDVEMMQRAQNIVMLIVPGIVTCCNKIAGEPNMQNHKITCANIRLWGGVVGLVMADGGEVVAEEDGEKSTRPSTDQGYTMTRVKQQLQLQRTACWLRDTAEKLTVVTEALLRTQTHSHWKVRQRLALTTSHLLTNCSRNMAGSVGSLVCCLIVLSEDDIAEVRNPARQSLAELSCQLENDTGQPLLQLVETAFFNLLTSTPRIIRGTDEGSQVRCLSLLVGYLRLQDSKLPHVLSSGPFLHRLLVTLVHVSCLDTSHVSLLEECSIREVETDTVVCEPWKQLKYCNNSQKLRKLQDVCCVLRERADLQTIVHALLDMIDSNPEHTKEIIYLLNNIIAGGGADSMEACAPLVTTVVSMYIQPRMWAVPLAVSITTTVAEAQSNIIQVSLLAEGLGMFALAIGGQKFSCCLLRCLYPLLECAGSLLHPLSSAGLSAVQNVARACVGGGVTELVCANVDYLSHHITLRLKRAIHNPGVLSVLSVVMRHTSVKVLPSLAEIVEDVLVQSCDEFQESNANDFLRVFLTFLSCLRRWQGEPEVEESHTKPECNRTVIDQLLEYKRCLEAAHTLDNDDEPLEGELSEEMFTSEQSRGEEEIPEEEESKPKKVEPSVKLMVQVLERALHFLPSKDEQRQILVLDILREGVLLLRTEEDHFLPIVHKIWSPLVNRFQASQTRPLVIHRAFVLLSTLGNTARDFIRSRTLKQVLPSLCKILQDSSNQSLLKDSGSAYRLTQLYKLQRALLGGLGQLAVDLTVQERQIYDILEVAKLYLSTRQPAPLQELSRGLYLQLAAEHRDLVWLQLISVWSPVSELRPPTSELSVIKLDTCCSETSEYKKNVSELLQSIG